MLGGKFLPAALLLTLLTSDLPAQEPVPAPAAAATQESTAKAPKATTDTPAAATKTTAPATPSIPTAPAAPSVSVIPAEGAATPAPTTEGKAKEKQVVATAPTVPALLDRTEALKLAQSATGQKFPDANEVLAAQMLKVTYRKDGTYTQYDESYVKILTEKGRRANSTISSYYTIPYQLAEDCKILLVEIIKPDGKTVVVDLQKNAATVVDSSSMESNIYNPNDKIIQVNIPGLEIGDTLHYYMYDNIRHPRAAGIFCDLFLLEETRPLLRKDIHVEGPADFPLQKIAVRDPIAGSVTDRTAATRGTKEGHVVYKWQALNVPQAFPEPNTPPLYSCLQRLLISTAPDWPTVSRWYWKLCEKPLAATTPEMKNKALELAAAGRTPLEKVRAIFYWVSQEIRYLGITTETEAPGYEPHPVKDTFSNRHGVCRDKAALLAAMLRLADIEAYPVLINNGDKKDPEVAQPYFNHAITAAKIDGKYILMDSTDESTKELFPSYLDNRSYLVATPKGEPLHTSPIVPAQNNLLRIDTTGSLDEAGNLKATSVFSFDGINDNIYRGHFSRITPEERRRYFESRVKDIYGEAKVTACLIEPQNMQDTSMPLKVTLSFTADDILSGGNGMAMLPLPFLGARVGMVNFILGETGLEQRRFPLYTEIACGVEENLRITLPENLEKVAAMPVYKSLDNDELSWKRSLAKVDKSLMGKSSFLLKAVEFTPEQYKTLKEVLRQIEYNQRKLPLVSLDAPVAPASARQYADSDAVVLEDETTFVVLEPGHWVATRKMRKKVLTYAGQKASSEIKIDFNPVWEKVELTDATVTDSLGKISSISTQEINIMDQPWNGLAPRYPGGKTLVASLPGVDVGSTIAYTVRQECFNRPFFSMQDTFRGFDPTIHKTIVITQPKTLPAFQHRVVDANTTAAGQLAPSAGGNNIFQSERAEVDKTAVWRWSVDGEEAIKREPMLPPTGSFVPSLYVSACADNWQSFAATIHKALLQAATNQSAAAAKGRELGQKGGDKLQKIHAIRDFIAREVRSAGPEFSALPLSCLTPADKTLSDGYGNSADRAVLLHSLLTAADLQPEFYLCSRYPAARNLPLPQLELPSALPFDEVLIKLTLPDGEIWLNDTDQYDELGTTPSAGKLALELSSGTLSAVTTDATHRNKEDVQYNLNLALDGTAQIRKTRHIYGAEFGRLKKLFAEMPPEQRRRYQQEEISELSQAAHLIGEYKTEFKQYPGTITFTVEIPRFAVLDGKYLYFALPETLRGIFNLRADNRSNPILFSKQEETRITTLISLPKGVTVPLIAPKDFRWRSPAGGGQLEVSSLLITPAFLNSRGIGGPVGEIRAEVMRELSAGCNVLLFTHYADLDAVLYAPIFYAELLQAQSALSGNAARTVLLQIPAPTTGSNKK